jgi:hypothetical protein
MVGEEENPNFLSFSVECPSVASTFPVRPLKHYDFRPFYPFSLQLLQNSSDFDRINHPPSSTNLTQSEVGPKALAKIQPLPPTHPHRHFLSRATKTQKPNPDRVSFPAIDNHHPSLFTLQSAID